MTRREVLAKAYPLHFQRIMELSFRSYDNADADVDENPTFHLEGAFVWHNTEEGHEYWQALADGASKC
jgi:hypothetical protein